jgi:hypothetical protein
MDFEASSALCARGKDAQRVMVTAIGLAHHATLMARSA